MRPGTLAFAITVVAGCASDDPGTGPGPRPMIHSAAVAANPGNVLSAVISAHATHADSVSVVFHVSGATGTDSSTPAVMPIGDEARIPILGLSASTEYVLRVVAFGGRHREVGDVMTFTTGALPGDLPLFTAAGSDPSPGFVVFGTAQYGQIIDNTGRVVWYHRFANGPGLNFMPLPNGRYVARPGSADASVFEKFVEVDPLGNITRTLGCLGGLRPRLHDLISERDGSYWVMCDEIRTMDLRSEGGVENAQVTGTAIQHIASNGELIFQWSPFDHFAITDVDLASRTGSAVNWTHGNAIDLDTDGNLIASFRNLNEVTKIDANTGRVLWRLGGIRNEFTFVDVPAPAFARQHSVRTYAPGRLVLLDNSGDPAETRAERYLLDPELKTARLVQSYGTQPRVVTPIGGSVQHLPGGRTLVSFGTMGRVEEYDEAGRVLWRIEGNAGYVFRATRIASLYAPGAGLPR